MTGAFEIIEVDAIQHAVTDIVADAPATSSRIAPTKISANSASTSTTSRSGH